MATPGWLEKRRKPIKRDKAKKAQYNILISIYLAKLY